MGLQEVQKILWNGRLLTIALPEHYEDDNSDPVPFHTVIVQDGSYLLDTLVEEYPSHVLFLGVEPIEPNREHTRRLAEASARARGGEAEQHRQQLHLD